MWQKTGENGNNGGIFARRLVELARKYEATQCAIFLHTIGDEALEVYDTFTFTETEQDKIEPLIFRNSRATAHQRKIRHSNDMYLIRVHKTVEHSMHFYLTFETKRLHVNLVPSKIA